MTTVANWKEANEKVREIAGGYKLYHGTGNPIREACAIAVTDYFEVRVWIYPEGEGYGKPSTMHLVQIR